MNQPTRQASTLLWICAACLGLGLIGANFTRFIHAEARPWMKERLDFLPTPEVARALSLGHRNTASRLRWIDSFGYFSYQIEKRDDAVSGADGRGGFARLYDLLIGMDPHFEPYYLHASLTASGIVGDHVAAFRFLCLGVLRLPDSMPLWGNLVSHAAAYFALEARRPETLRYLLHSWSDVAGPENNAPIERWLTMLGKRQATRSPVVDYWLAQLTLSPVNSPAQRLAETTARRELAVWQQELLQTALVCASRTQRPLTAFDLDWSRVPALSSRLPYSPLHPSWRLLLPDPWGGRWRIQGKQVLPALELQQPVLEFSAWDLFRTAKGLPQTGSLVW